MTHDLVMPSLSCPFPRQQHPSTAQAEAAVDQWLATSDFTVGNEQLAVHYASRFGTFAAMSYPQAAGDEQLALAARWLAWLCVFDDRYLDESPQGADTTALADVLISALSVLTPPHVPKPQIRHETGSTDLDPVLDTLRSLVADIAALASPVQLQRLTGDLVTAMYAAYLDAGAWHAARRIPDLSEYRVTRQYSGAVLSCLSLIDIVSGYEVRAEEFCHSQVRALRAGACNVITWSNDIFSYFKERRRSQFDVNLPLVLAHQEGCTAQEALDRAARIHDEEVDAYLKGEAVVLTWASPELTRYLGGLRAWMQGNHYWSLESGRYGLTTEQVKAVLQHH